ncbi:UNVERIFIED_ORG: DNA-binding CsgD family transcriptional regulator [Sphingomonas sp. R1F5B]
MAAPEPAPVSLAALNDKEREVLRLLTAGHTVKSIALQLGRSEASINERLRDARRKTGVGSSRELARMLAAQKSWDRNPELTGPGKAPDTAGAPRIVGRRWSKGLLAMLTALSLAAAGLLVSTGQVLPPRTGAALPAPTAQATPAKAMPLLGRWSLDVTRIPAEERPQKVTIAFAKAADGRWTTMVDMIGPDGTAHKAESTAALDGVPAPVTGTMDFIDTVSLRQPAPNTLVMTLGKNGAPVSTRVYAVAKDQRSMTETIIWPGNAIPGLETTTFHRVE